MNLSLSLSLKLVKIKISIMIDNLNNWEEFLNSRQRAKLVEEIKKKEERESLINYNLNLIRMIMTRY